MGKDTLGKETDFVYFSNFLQTKETAWKRGDTIFLEPKMLRSSLGEFRKALTEIGHNESLMALSLEPK